MSWQRARQPEQVNERITAILNAAGELFDEKKELSEISMRDVASRAGLGKASLYHYFKTKEEVFITLFKAEMDAWLPEIQRGLKRLRRPTSKRIASVLADSLADRQRFCRLMVVFASVLERNLSLEFIRDFKYSLLEPAEQFVSSLRAVAPHLSVEAAKDFLFQHHALVAGLWPLAHPSDEASQILEDDAFTGFRVDFFKLLERTFEQLLLPPEDSK